MTEKDVEATIRKYVAEAMDRDTVSGELPVEANEGEIQQVFEVLVAGAHEALRQNKEWYRRLLEANDQDAEKSIKWFVEESRKMNKPS